MTTPDTTLVIGITMGVATVATLLYDLFVSVERQRPRQPVPSPEAPHAETRPDPLAGIEVVRVTTDGSGCHPAFISSPMIAARRELPALSFASASGFAQAAGRPVQPGHLGHLEVLRRIGLNYVRESHPLFRDPAGSELAPDVVYQPFASVPAIAAPGRRPAQRFHVIRTAKPVAGSPRASGHLRLLTDGDRSGSAD